MNQAPAILVIILGISIALSALLAAFAYTRLFRVPQARCLFFLILSSITYMLGYAIELSRTDLAGILAAIRLEYIGISFQTTILLLFTLRFVFRRSIPLKVVLPLLVIPTITLIMVYTLSYHDLFYINPRLDTSGPFPVLTFERGIWYFVHFIYQQVTASFAVILLVLSAFKTNSRRRFQSVIVAVGVIIPVLAGFLYFLSPFGLKIDIVPFSLPLTAILLGYAVFGWGLIELVPAGRALAVDSIREAFLVFDHKRRLQDMNPAARELPGAAGFVMGEELPKYEPLTHNLSSLISRSIQTNEFSMDMFEINGLHYEAKAHPLKSSYSHKGGIAILITDITETVNSFIRLNHQASIDELTGVLNRRSLLSFGEEALMLAKKARMSIGIIIIDLDKFKEINDLHGHLTGDIILRQVTQCLRNGLRANDIFGRYGGDEFVAFLPNTDQYQAEMIIERLKSSLAQEKFTIGEMDFTLSACYGVITVLPQTGIKIERLLEMADEQLYFAKRQAARSNQSP